MLNRTALILRPAEPYMAWARNLDPNVVPDPEGEATVYLLPSAESEEEMMDYLELAFPYLFASELHGWHTDDAAWPSDRTFEMFKAWFRIEWHSVVEDLGEEPIYDEDDVSDEEVEEFGFDEDEDEDEEGEGEDPEEAGGPRAGYPIP